MKFKILSRRTLLIIVLIGFALSPAILFYFIPKNSIQSGLALLIEDAATLLKQEQARSGLPVRLKIPKLNVDAGIQYMGLTPDGVMEIPNNIFDVGWFTGSPRPGEKGNAVITGHVAQIRGGILTKPGVFNNLNELKLINICKIIIPTYLLPLEK